MSAFSLDTDKVEARKVASRRRKVAAQAQPDAAQDIAAVFMQTFATQLPSPESRVCIGGYRAIGSELDPMPLMQHLHGLGYSLALPAIIAKGQALHFRRYCPGDTLIKENFGTYAPRPDQEECLPSLLLVPMLAFDDRGYRLGYGGGFYDRTLAAFQQMGHVCQTVGLAYAAQHCAVVPAGAYDIPLLAIATEQGVLSPQ